MTYFTNTSKSAVLYRGKLIRPGESVMLDDHGFPSKGEYTYAEEKLLALDDDIEKASKKAKEDLGDLDERIEKKVTSLTGDLVTAVTNIVGNVDNLNEYMCGLETCIEVVEAKVGDAVSIANTANTNATTANTTATNAATAAATAQSTANTAKTNAATAKTNAATAQSTADTAKTNAATALSCAENAMTEAKSKVTLATLDTRLSAEETKTKTLITSCTSKVNFDFGSRKPIYNNTCLHKTDGKPVEFFDICCCYPLNIEPGIYLGSMPKECLIEMCNIPLGKEWTYNTIKCCDVRKCTVGSGTCKNEMGRIFLRVSPKIRYKKAHNFTCTAVNQIPTSIYEIDEDSAKNSYLLVETKLTCQNEYAGNCYVAYCCWRQWDTTTNNPYACVKTCIEAFAKCSICISNTLTRLQ